MARGRSEGLDVDHLRARTRTTFAAVAADPRAGFHFHCGASYAAKQLNYSADDIAEVPPASAQRFTGTGNPHRAGPLRAGETVLDHACGAGMDLVIAAKRVGPRGRAIGVDMTREMLEAAWEGIVAAGTFRWSSLFHDVYEDLPVDDASIDVVISNGALNLAPDKEKALAEIVRVLKPGGRLHLADVVVQCELDANTRRNPVLWSACVAGALQESALLELAAACGLVQGRITERFDCFRGAAAEHAVPEHAGIGGVNFFARKPII